MKFKPPEFTVDIPENRTAQYPKENRDDSNLLVFNKSANKIIHIGRFKDITDFIATDTIILNNTKVIPAMVEGRKHSGGRVTALFMPEIESSSKIENVALGGISHGFIINSLINPGRRLKPAVRIEFPNKCEYELISKNKDGVWIGRMYGISKEQFPVWLKKTGAIPLPPYISRETVSSDRQRYQTVYAERAGSLAAPTAGFHFTEQLLAGLESSGAVLKYLSLNIGLGTFQPLRSGDFSEFEIHSESYDIPSDTAKVINYSLEDNTPITLVGTTVMRTLESAVRDRKLKGGSGIAKIFISPPYDFQVSERLLTNFHRSDSTIIQLVAGLIGWESLNHCYRTALDGNFSFYSYGDAMLII